MFERLVSTDYAGDNTIGYYYYLMILLIAVVHIQVGSLFLILYRYVVNVINFEYMLKCYLKSRPRPIFFYLNILLSKFCGRMIHIQTDY